MKLEVFSYGTVFFTVFRCPCPCTSRRRCTTSSIITSRSIITTTNIMDTATDMATVAAGTLIKISKKKKRVNQNGIGKIESPKRTEARSSSFSNFFSTSRAWPSVMMMTNTSSSFENFQTMMMMMTWPERERPTRLEQNQNNNLPELIEGTRKMMIYRQTISPLSPS